MEFEEIKTAVEEAYKITKKGVKHDSGKPRFSLLPLDEVWDVVDVLEEGAKEYGLDNWKYVALEDKGNMRYIDALQRHIYAWSKGELLDPKDNLPHLAHATCCLLFQAWKDKNINNLDYKCE